MSVEIKIRTYLLVYIHTRGSTNKTAVVPKAIGSDEHVRFLGLLVSMCACVRTPKSE